MIRLVEIYKNSPVAKHSYGYGQSIDEDRYSLREVYCNESAISTMREWTPPEGSLLPVGIETSQNFTSIEITSGASCKTLFIVKGIEHLNEDIQGNLL